MAEKKKTVLFILGCILLLFSLKLVLPFWGITSASPDLLTFVESFGLEVVLFFSIIILAVTDYTYKAFKISSGIVLSVVILLSLVNMLHEFGVWGYTFPFVDLEFISSMLLVESIILTLAGIEFIRKTTDYDI